MKIQRFSAILYMSLTLLSPLASAPAAANGVNAEDDDLNSLTCWELLMSDTARIKKIAIDRLQADLAEFSYSEQLGEDQVLFRDGAFDYFAKRVFFLNENGKIDLIKVNVSRLQDLAHYRDLIDIKSSPPRGIAFNLKNVNYYVVPKVVFDEMRSITAKKLGGQNKTPAERMKEMPTTDRLDKKVARTRSSPAPKPPTTRSPEPNGASPSSSGALVVTAVEASEAVSATTGSVAPAHERPSRQIRASWWTLDEFTVQKKWEFSFAPSRSRLSLERPLAFISFFKRPGWAALDFNFMKSYGVSEAINAITREAGIRQLDQRIVDRLWNLYSQPDEEILAIPARRLRGQGGSARMHDLVRDQVLMVAEQDQSLDGEGHRVIMVPLMSLQDEDPRASRKNPDEPPAEATALPDIVKPFVPPSPIVRDASTDIYADNVPAIQHIVVFFGAHANWRNFVPEKTYFERQMWMNLHLANPLDWASGRYELPLLWFDELDEFRIAQVIFTFSRGNAGEAYLNIESINELDDRLQKDFFVRFARFHRIANSTFHYPTPISVGRKKTSSLTLPGHVQAKLMLKHRLEIDDIRNILSLVKSAPQSERALKAKVQYKGVEYYVIVGHDERGNSYYIRSLYAIRKHGWPWLNRYFDFSDSGQNQNSH